MRQIRRYVVGVGQDGKSCTQYDNCAPVSMAVGQSGAVGPLWFTNEMPVDNAGEQDRALGPFHPFPVPNGTVFSYALMPPESEIDPKMNPGMHTTRSLDYGIVVEGEVWFKTEKDEFLAKAGDTVICRGARHMWVNRTDQPCLVFFFVVDAL